jgi:hypothetical protein
MEELGGGRGDNTPLADEVDVIRLNEDREMHFATRSLLVVRANQLAEALERLRGGEYGVCEDAAGDRAARLRVMPEAPACAVRTGSSGCCRAWRRWAPWWTSTSPRTTSPIPTTGRAGPAAGPAGR